MNGFSNDWFGSSGFRTMGSGINDGAPKSVSTFTAWSHGAPAPMAGSPAEMPAPRLETPNFGPARSFAPMQREGFLGAVKFTPRGTR